MVIIVVFVSLGGLLLLACLAAFCLHKKKKRKTERRAEVLNFSDHVHVHKSAMSGPGGSKAVRLTVDEDVKFQEVVKESEAVDKESGTATAGNHNAWMWNKKQKSKAKQDSEVINATGHIHVDEKIESGPHGEKIEVLSEDEDIRFEEADNKEKSSAKSKARVTKF
ncbi:hypothetical protein CFC21_092915 [Triticum aestivum]|nr:hypothetical protein CFC21_092915 [Triticum aestivum]